MRSSLTDRTLDVPKDEGARELAISRTLQASIPASARRSGAVAVPPRAELLAGITTGSFSQGGALVSEAITVGDVLRPETVLTRLGARRTELPEGFGGRRLVSPSRVTAGWVNPDLGESTSSRTITFGSSTALPREGHVRVDVTRAFLRDAEQAETLLQEVMREAHESEAERVQIVGSGTNSEPAGILASASAGDVPSASGVLDYAGLTGALQAALDSGARLRQTGFLLPLADHEDLLRLERAGGYPSLSEGSDGWRLAGRPAEFSDWLPSGYAICGEFGQLQVVYQGIPQIMTNPYSRTAQQITEISIFDVYDVAIGRPNLLRVITP